MNDDVNALVEADSKRPYKLYAAMLSAFLTTLATSDAPMPTWLKALILAAVSGLAVYIVRNPIKRKDAFVNNEDALF